MLDRERTWEKSIAGRSPNDFRPYRTSEIFEEGELVRHSKFGDGVVLSGAALASTGVMTADFHPERAILYRAEALD